MTDYKVSKAKELNWSNLGKALLPLGWQLIKSKKDLKIFERGFENLAASKFGKQWKVEYLVNKRLRDSAGFSEEWLARVILMQMALMRSK